MDGVWGRECASVCKVVQMSSSWWCRLSTRLELVKVEEDAQKAAGRRSRGVLGSEGWLDKWPRSCQEESVRRASSGR